MLNAVWVLVRARLLIARNTFWRGTLRRKIGVVVLLVLAGLAAWGLYNFSSFAIAFLNRPEVEAALREGARQFPELDLPTNILPLLQAVPGVLLFAALLLLILSSFSSLLSSLYLSGDMDMLLATPVPMRAVFLVKFFDGLLTQYILLFVLVGPILLGYGQGLGYGGLYHLVAVWTLFLLPLLPAGLGALLVMAVVRVIPPRRARDIVSVLGGVLGVGFYVVSQLTPEVAPRLASVRTVDSLLQLNIPLLPSAWAGRALVAAGEGDSLTLLFFGGLFVILSLVTFAACLLLAERLYYVGWSNMAMQGGRVRSRNRSAQPGAPRSRRRRLSGVAPAVLPPQVYAIFLKDWRIFPRDLRNLQRLIFPLALAGIWTFRLLTQSGPASEFAPPADGTGTASLAGLGSAGIAFFLCLTLANAVAGSGISREGHAFWLLKLAPVHSRHILLGKLILAYLPFPTVGTLFLILLAFLQRTSPAGFATGWALLLLVGFGSTCVSLGLGAVFPRLDWENPQQQTTLRAGCLSLLVYTIYILIAVSVVLGLPVLAGLLANDPQTADQLALLLSLIGWGLALALTGLVAWGSLFLGTRALDRLQL